MYVYAYTLANATDPHATDKIANGWPIHYARVMLPNDDTILKCILYMVWLIPFATTYQYIVGRKYISCLNALKR